MPKHLMILCAWALLWTGIMVAQPNSAPQGEQQSAKQGQPAVISSHGQNEQSDGEANQPKSPSDSAQGNASFKWPAGISDADDWLVIVGFLTVGVIAWQSWETRKAAQGALGAADATLQQSQLMREKERARLIVRPYDLAYETGSEKGKSWNLRVAMAVENIGAGKAFDIEGRASLWVQDSYTPLKPGLFLPWHSEPKFRISAGPGNYCVHVDSQIIPFTVDDFVSGITTGPAEKFFPNKVICLQGFVDYETLGVKFRRHFEWLWLPGALRKGEGMIKGLSVQGHWSEDSSQNNGEEIAN